MEKIDRLLNIMGSMLDIFTAVACIVVVGIVAYTIFGVMDISGFVRIFLTGISAVIGGLFLNLIFRVFASF